MYSGDKKIYRNHHRARVLNRELEKIMNKDKIKTKEVWSANGWYLFLGIVSVLIICMLERYAIREFYPVIPTICKIICICQKKVVTLHPVLCAKHTRGISSSG